MSSYPFAIQPGAGSAPVAHLEEDRPPRQIQRQAHHTVALLWCLLQSHTLQRRRHNCCADDPAELSAWRKRRRLSCTCSALPCSPQMAELRSNYHTSAGPPPSRQTAGRPQSRTPSWPCTLRKSGYRNRCRCPASGLGPNIKVVNLRWQNPHRRSVQHSYRTKITFGMHIVCNSLDASGEAGAIRLNGVGSISP